MKIQTDYGDYGFWLTNFTKNVSVHANPNNYTLLLLFMGFPQRYQFIPSALAEINHTVCRASYSPLARPENAFQSDLSVGGVLLV